MFSFVDTFFRLSSGIEVFKNQFDFPSLHQQNWNANPKHVPWFSKEKWSENFEIKLWNFKIYWWLMQSWSQNGAWINHKWNKMVHEQITSEPNSQHQPTILIWKEIITFSLIIYFMINNEGCIKTAKTYPRSNSYFKKVWFCPKLLVLQFTSS